MTIIQCKSLNDLSDSTDQLTSQIKSMSVEGSGASSAAAMNACSGTSVLCLSSTPGHPHCWTQEDAELGRGAVEVDEVIDQHISDSQKAAQRRPSLNAQANCIAQHLICLETQPMIVLDAWRGDLIFTSYLHMKSPVVYDHIPLLQVILELRIKHGIDIK